MTTVSVTAYAKLHDVSKAAAQKWQARGLLRFKDGKVDVEASDQMLAHAGVGRFADAATKARRSGATDPATETRQVAGLPSAMIGDLEAAAAEGDEQARTVLQFMEGLSEGKVVDLIWAQTIKENALAAIRMIEARRRAGEVIELGDAEAILFEQFRLHRNAWLNFPARVGPLMAADLGLAPERVTEVLTEHVHKHLADLGEPENQLREAGAASPDGEASGDAAAAPDASGVG